MGTIKFAVVGSLVLLASCHHIDASARVRQCGWSSSPDGRHFAFFTWQGGQFVNAVGCSGRCEGVLRLPRTHTAYRWSGTDRLDFASIEHRTETKLAQIGDLSVYAVPVGKMGSASIVKIPDDCGFIENVIIDE